MRLHQTFQLPGEPVQNPELFARAWDEFPELKCNSRADWCGRSLHMLADLERWEIGVIHDNTVIGGLVLVEDPWECHVGPCLTVAAQYVLPEYRNQGVSGMLMRQALRVVKSQPGPKTLAYTHRVGPWRYETIYRRIP